MNSFNNSGQIFTGHSPINYGSPTVGNRDGIAPRTRYFNKPEGMTDLEYQDYLATCEESYDITKQTLALYTLHPNVLYAI